MILDLAHQHLRWPIRDQVLKPSGAGPGVYARLADEKVGRALRRLPDAAGLQVGILAAAPTAKATEAPLAIVCEFSRPVSQQTLRETHRLAWSFCRSPLLITLEPHAIRAWTCCEPPQPLDLMGSTATEIPGVRINLGPGRSIPQQAADSLSWLDLVSGEFFRRHEGRFRRDQCADQLLLEYLKDVREKLTAQRLNIDTAHDLLARLIFIQFLCDRKDTAGKPALGAPELRRLHERRVLSEPYTDLADILESHEDTYGLFRCLNETFNGDLFPGKGATLEQRETEWQDEMLCVQPQHLQTLAQFVSGKIEMRGGQRLLFREYAFDTIPLEFISSIYEEFVSKRGDTKGAHYTPAHIVDFMLDRVLPWDSDEWDIKVLDPACGSGIFLVKAYQRLIHRWKNAHAGREPKVAILKQLLTRNLFGVDVDRHAVRVASFSLYLAMCDEIDPRHYWTKVQFPRLRDERLITADFFSEDSPGVRTEEDGKQYDLVVGNAPWGKDTETTAAKQWKHEHKWSTSYGSIGPLFLPKAARLTRPGGHVAMLQPAGLLFHGVGPARTLRSKLFSTHRVEEVVNLSALRFGLFKGAVSPACLVALRAMEPDGEPLVYISPKPVMASEDDYRVIIEPHDVHLIRPDEAAHDRHVWTALMWGGRRDLHLIRRLSELPTLEQLEQKQSARTRKGRFRGDRKRKQPLLVGMPLLEDDGPLEDVLLFLNAKSLPTNTDPYTHSRDSTDMSAFRLPQMIIKHSWLVGTGRLKSVLVRSDERTGAVFCSRNFTSVHADDPRILEAACLVLNSSVAVYYLLLTSGRLASYRPEPNKKDLLRVPIAEPMAGLLHGIDSLRELDARCFQALALSAAEVVHVDDLNSITLRDFKGDASSPGRQPTKRGAETDLKAYGQSFARVLRAGFGSDKRVCTTVFQETGDAQLPVRLVAVHLGWPESEDFRREPLPAGELRSRLEELNDEFLGTPAGSEGGIYYRRVARVYNTVTWHGVKVPTVYLIKPDRLRYWTRSAAMRDADEVAADLMSWRDGADAPTVLTAEHRIA